MSPQHAHGKKFYFLLGAVCVTLSFLAALIAGGYISDANSRENYLIAKYLPALQATEAALDATVRELESEGQQVARSQDGLPDDTVWLADVDTGEIVFASGRSKGVRKNLVYDLYDGQNSLGQFRIGQALRYLSLGRVIDYQKSRFPENRRFFRAQLSR